MTTTMAMKEIGQIDGFRVFWADPTLFPNPGLFYWNGRENVRIPLPVIQPSEAMQAIKKVVDAAVEATDRLQILRDACEPWNKHTNLEIPDWDSPLHGVFMMGVLWAEDQMAKVVAPPGEPFSYDAGDGTEEIEGDFQISILNMLAAARLYDREDGRWGRLSPPEEA